MVVGIGETGHSQGMQLLHLLKARDMSVLMRNIRLQSLHISRLLQLHLSWATGLESAPPCP
jgi:hypothetical protein